MESNYDENYHGEFFKPDPALTIIKNNIFSGNTFVLDITPAKHRLSVDKVYPSYIDYIYDFKVPLWKIEASSSKDKKWFIGLLVPGVDLENRILMEPEFHFYFWEYSKGYEGKSRNIDKNIIDGQYAISKRRLHKDSFDNKFKARVDNGAYFSIFKYLDK